MEFTNLGFIGKLFRSESLSVRLLQWFFRQNGWL